MSDRPVLVDRPGVYRDVRGWCWLLAVRDGLGWHTHSDGNLRWRSTGTAFASDEEEPREPLDEFRLELWVGPPQSWPPEIHPSNSVRQSALVSPFGIPT